MGLGDLDDGCEAVDEALADALAAGPWPGGYDAVDETRPLAGLDTLLPAGRRPQRGLFMGAAGIILGVTTALSEAAPPWDGLLLLDGLATDGAP